MNQNYILKNSTWKNKKYMLIEPAGKAIHFGAKGMSDYTINKDPKRRENYILRHQVREDWTKINAGSLSRWILWHKINLNDAIDSFATRFSI